MRAVAIALVLSFPVGPGVAQVQWSGEIGAATDYVKRGLSRSDGEAHVFAGATASSGAFYAGGWASTADLGDAKAEVDLYVGWRPELAGYQLDVSAARNVILGDDDLSYTDVQVQVSREIGPVRFGALIGGSPDYLGAEEAFWAQADASVELYRHWRLSATLGREHSDLSDYAYWSLGSSWAVTDRLAVEIRYWGTDGAGDRQDDRVVAGVRATF